MEKLTIHEISRLIYLSIIGRLTSDQRAVLDAWIEESQENKAFVEDLVETSALEKGWHMTKRVNTSRPADHMMRQIQSMKRNILYKRISVAVAACVIVCAGTWIANELLHQSNMSDISTEMSMANAEPMTLDDIKPGTSKAILKTTTGEEIDLATNGSGGQSITPIAATQLLKPEPESLCLEVPRGGEFKIVLEDSTVVWLNSQSTLRYPETFAGSERRVEISGEAYFEVKKDESRPFYVESNGQEIRVYGTSFNVKAYDDEAITYTTLETGVISLRQSEGKSGEIMLSPGHQARYSHQQQSIDMRVVNTETVTQWRHGRFVFEDQTLGDIMRDLSRWYDFEYVFADQETAKIEFLGSIPRYADFKTAITILEKCGSVEFTVSDNKIVISPIKD